MMNIKNKGKFPILAGLFVLVASVSFGTTSHTVKAQDKAKKPQSSWVKLCDKATFRKSKEAKPEQKEICLTHHERLDGNTGLVLVSAAIRKIQGQDKERFMIMVPLGMAIPPGVQVKIDEDKPVKLPFSICTPGGCTAEINADKAFIDKMKKGKRMVVAAINRLGKPIGFPVPLNGFGTALAGKAIDNKKYHAARRELLGKIRERRIALQKKYKEEQKKKKAEKK